jgi:hypothetical protein
MRWCTEAGKLLSVHSPEIMPKMPRNGTSRQGWKIKEDTTASRGDSDHIDETSLLVETPRWVKWPQIVLSWTVRLRLRRQLAKVELLRGRFRGKQQTWKQRRSETPIHARTWSSTLNAWSPISKRGHRHFEPLSVRLAERMHGPGLDPSGGSERFG